MKLKSCIAYLEDAAFNFPDRTAATDATGSVTFAQLRLRALKIAAQIPGGFINNPIGVYLPKGIDCLASFMAVLYSGNFYIPLDVKAPFTRLEQIIQDLVPKVIITQDSYCKTLSNLGSGCIPELLAIDRLPNEIDGNEVDYLPKIRLVIYTDPIYCIYTSGSTGAQKGVVVSHQSVRDFIEWAQDTYELTENSVIGNQSPFLFDVSTLDIYLCLKNKAHLHIIPEFLFAFPLKLMEYVEKSKITFIIWVPSVLVNVANAGILAERKFPQLKQILFAGEVMPNKQLNHWRKHLPLAMYSNLYGPTEITVIASYYIVDREFRDDEPLPIGVRCNNCDLIVLTSDGRQASENELGELCVRGSSLALGYWNDALKTSQAFVQNPLNTHYPERIYRTGDLVKYNELGELLYAGRFDSQIKHMGYRIELGDIETAAGGIKQLANACVLYDKKDSQIALFYVAQDVTADDADLRKLLLTRLPKYMVPTKFFSLDKLPLNSNGKIDKPTLEKKYLS